jgi:peptidoglycan/LPS O-acetylase OafA/YrhL
MKGAILIHSAHNERSSRPLFSQWLTSILEGKKQKSTIASLDGIRAIACLIVVAYHISLITTNDIKIWNPSLVPGWLDALAFSGDTGVTLFFVLSGFLLFLPYAKALLFQAPWPSLRQFYLRRALRILPAYYVSLFLMMLIYHPEYLHRDHLKQIFLFMTLFLDSSPLTFKQINGPFWTLAVEWQFYLLLPLLAFGISLIVRRGGLIWRCCSLTVCLGLLIGWGLITRYMGLYLTDHPSETFHMSPIVLKIFLFFCYGIPTAGLHGKFLEDFAVGMIVSSAYLLIRAYPEQSRPSVLLSKLSPWIFLVGLSWLYFMAFWKYDDRVEHTWPVLDRLLPYYPPMSEFGYSVGYGLCVFAILLTSGFLKRIFEWQPLRWIGLLSFGLYMWHLLLLEFLTPNVILPLFLAGWSHKVLYSFYWIWLFVFILPCMLLLFVCIEKPGMQLAARFRGKTSTRNVTETDNRLHSDPAPQSTLDSETALAQPAPQSTLDSETALPQPAPQSTLDPETALPQTEKMH